MTNVDVCNLALASLGSDRHITDVDAQTREARLCRQWLGVARRNVLSTVICGELVYCTPMLRGVAEGGRYKYVLPQCGQVLWLEAVDRHGAVCRIGEVRGSVAYLYVPEAGFRVVADVEDMERMPHLMQMAVVAELARRIAYGLTGKPDVAAQAANNAQAALSEARAHYANVTRPVGSQNPYAQARSEGWA